MTATLTVVPGEILNVFVGGQGGTGAARSRWRLQWRRRRRHRHFPGGGGGAARPTSAAAVMHCQIAWLSQGAEAAARLRCPAAQEGAQRVALAPTVRPDVTGGGGGTQSAGGLGGANPLNPANNGQPGTSGTGGAGGVLGRSPAAEEVAATSEAAEALAALYGLREWWWRWIVVRWGRRDADRSTARNPAAATVR